MGFFNKHRNNANISDLSWDSALVSVADTAGHSHCTGEVTLYKLLSISLPSKNKSANMAADLRRMLEGAYSNFTSEYEYNDYKFSATDLVL